MSEKKLRQALEMERQWLGRPAYDMHSYDSIRETAWRLGEEALADQPDVVKVLRWANERRAHYLDQVTLSHDCLRDVNFYKGKAGMAAEIQGYCQRVVRLTKTGWEWTDD